MFFLYFYRAMQVQSAVLHVVRLSVRVSIFAYIFLYIVYDTKYRYNVHIG